jgi:hypothetical protein
LPLDAVMRYDYQDIDRAKYNPQDCDHPVCVTW